MNLVRACLPWCLMLLPVVAVAAAVEVGTITLVEGGARLLRGTTWYRVVVGARVEDADIVTSADRALVQLEFTSGGIASFVGAGTLYLPPAAAGAPMPLVMPAGWLKVAARAPGVLVRTPAFDAMTVEGILIVHAQAATAELFVEAGSARLVDPTASGTDGAAREAKRGEHWSKSAAAAYVTVPRAPKAFVDAMPRHFVDPLPVLAAKAKPKPQLNADGEITFAEAQPWLDGRDRAVFERRFASRLRDPAFRKAVEPYVARYPSWDRMLHPEKYAPKPAPVK